MNKLDEIAANYHLANNPDMFIERVCQEEELDWVVRQLEPGTSILELGYGDGITSAYLGRNLKLTVVEGSEILCNVARLNFENRDIMAEVTQSLFEEYSPNEKFDYVFASHILEHVENAQIILEQIKQWIKPNGKIVFIVPNSESLHRRVAVLMGIQPELNTLSERDHLVGHVRVYSYKEIRSELEENGFEIEVARGMFLKALSNGQMLNLSEDVIRGLCHLSSQLPIEYCASLVIIAKIKA